MNIQGRLYHEVTKEDFDTDSGAHYRDQRKLLSPKKIGFDLDLWLEASTQVWSKLNNYLIDDNKGELEDTILQTMLGEKINDTFFLKRVKRVKQKSKRQK